MPMGPDEIVQKEFSRSFFGYDMQEVDSFLDDVIDQFEKLEGERKEMISAMEYLLNKLENKEELPAIKAKYLKGMSFAPDKKLPPKNRPQDNLDGEKGNRPQKKKEYTTRIKEQVIMDKARPTPPDVAQSQTPEERKQPPRKILWPIEKMRRQTMEPVAIEMETMESAPVATPEYPGAEDVL